MSKEISIADLQAYADAFNRHDPDGIMSFMTGDCIFVASSGPDPEGARIEGAEAVRDAFIGVWQAYPDAHWEGTGHMISGDRGVSQWRFTGTSRDGDRVEVDGLDLFTFRDGKIHIKNTFRKTRT